MRLTRFFSIAESPAVGWSSHSFTGLGLAAANYSVSLQPNFAVTLHIQMLRSRKDITGASLITPRNRNGRKAREASGWRKRVLAKNDLAPDSCAAVLRRWIPLSLAASFF